MTNSFKTLTYATSWTVRVSNPGGGVIFRTFPDRPWSPSSLLSNRYGILPGRRVGGGKRPGSGLDRSFHLAPRLKKEYSNTSTPLLGLRRLL